MARRYSGVRSQFREVDVPSIVDSLVFLFFFSKSRPDHTWPDLDGILVSPTFPHIQTLNCTFGTLRNKSSRSLKILKF